MIMKVAFLEYPPLSNLLECTSKFQVDGLAWVTISSRSFNVDVSVQTIFCVIFNFLNLDR